MRITKLERLSANQKESIFTKERIFTVKDENIMMSGIIVFFSCLVLLRFDGTDGAIFSMT